MDEDQLEAIDTSSGDESAGLDTSRRIPAGEDNSGAAPVSAPPDDNSGAAPVAAPQQEAGAIDTGEDSTGPNGPIARNVKAFPGNVKRIVSYLMGEGADDPAVLKQAGAQVDPQGQLSADDRNLLAVQKTAESAGPEAAWKLVQANRVAYNAKQAFAYAALNGTQQKPPDLNAAIDAANQAASHVLDGSSVQFAPSQGGVTATVKAPGAEQAQVLQLSPDAFRRYLNVGGAGQYDRVMGQTIPQTLAALSRGGGQGQDRIAQQRPLPKAAQAGAIDTSEPAEVPQTNFGKTPSTMNLSGSNEVQAPRPTAVEERNYGDELEARARNMFPSVSQEGQRNAWMADQEARYEGNQNKIDVAGETGRRREEVARITGQSRVQGENIKADASRANAQTKADGYAARDANKAKIEAAKIDQRMREMGSRNNNATQHEQMASVRSKILSMQPLTPQETELYTRVMGKAPGDVQQPQQQAPQQQAPAPQKQGNAQQPPVPGAKLYKGTWYTRGPNGESVPYNQ